MLQGSATEGNERLMITKMVLENFKSYAGAQEIGPFHKRFSSIVGPNGSGKSNVIDALLFVFGKRAKQLRLNKVSELIHKSANFPNLEYARVSVYFQIIYDDEESSDNYEVKPNSEFVITRIAYQNNSSKYTINDATSTFTDVGKILTSFGIDLENNRFLILQGEVEQIAMMKPKGQTPQEEGLLEYLEDIIGSNKFVEMIEKVSKELDEITEQRVEKVNKLKLAEKERDNLSGSKLEAEAYLENDKETRRLRNQVCQYMELEANRAVESHTKKQEKATEKLAYERNKLVEADKVTNECQKKYDSVKSEHDKVSYELQTASSQYDAFERNDVKIQEDMKFQKANIKKQQAIIAKEVKKVEESLKEADEIAAQKQKYQNLSSDYQAKRAADEAEVAVIMESLQESTVELRQKLEGAQADLLQQEKSVSTLQTEKESIETTASLLQNRAQSAAKALSGALEKAAGLKAEIETANAKIAGLEAAQRSDLVKQIAAAEDLIARCEQEEQVLQNQVRDAVTAAELAKATLASQQQTKQGGSVVVQKILQASKKGGRLAAAGVLGRLGDLAVIAPEYDVAISTACGALDHIVVDTVEGAQSILSYLRETNGGRASFIALDQMDEWKSRMNSNVSRLPAGVSRLFDLIKPEHEKYLPAFYMALRDTLVTPDLESACKIAYVGDRAVWRVVTQDGNLIDTSGAMSGGGKEVRSGGMRVASAAAASKSKSASTSQASSKKEVDEDEITPAQVQKLEARVVDLQAQLSACRAKRGESEQQLKDLKRKQKDQQTELEKTRMAVGRYMEQQADLEERTRAMKKDADLSVEEKAQLAKLQNQLQQVDEEMVRVSPNLRGMQSEVASLQRQILSVGGPKLTKIQSRIDSYTAQLDTFSSSLSTKAVEEANCRKQAEKAAISQTKAEQECTKSEARLQELVAQQKAMEADALEVVNAVEAAKSRLEGLETELQEISKQFHDLKAMSAKVRSVEVDLAVEMERIAHDLKDAKSVAKKWRLEAEAVRKLHLEEAREFQQAVAAVKPMLPVGGGATPVAEGEMDVEAPVAAASEQDTIDELPMYTEEQLEGVNVEELKREISVLEAQRNKMKNSVNMNALIEYMKKDANYKCRLYELEQITESRNVIRRNYEDLRRQRLEAFMAGFGVIALKLKEMYQMITLGGDAELELLDSLDPFSEGIVFSVRPPRKSWKNISNLSGGEKTLSSLALVFALHHYKPTPLYVMDEIDAALDFKNVSIVANYIKDRTKNAQFVIISLRNNMFELADRLVGIYKTHDATKSVTINPKLFEAATAGEKPTSRLSVAVGDKLASNSSSKPKQILADVTNRR